MANREFKKALTHIEREIRKQEAVIAKQVAKCDQLKRNYSAMKEFVGGIVPIGTGSAGIKRNLFPDIISFIEKNPGCTVADIRRAVDSSEQTVRYHLKKNSGKFKVALNSNGHKGFQLRHPRKPSQVTEISASA